MTYDSALRKRIAPDNASWCSVRSIYIGEKCENVQEMKKNVASSSSFCDGEREMMGRERDGQKGIGRERGGEREIGRDGW